MTDTEIYLYKYLDAKKEIARLLNDLDGVKARYESAYERPNMATNYSLARVKKPAEMSVVERTVILIVDGLRAEVEAVEGKLKEARYTIDMIEHTVKLAGLDGREREYVRLRYFEGRSAESTAIKMGISERTRDGVRNSALGKLDRALQGDIRPGKVNGQATPQEGAGSHASGSAGDRKKAL